LEALSTVVVRVVDVFGAKTQICREIFVTLADAVVDKEFFSAQTFFPLQ
jgi:hypothetical protein